MQFIKTVSNELIDLMGGGTGAKDLEPGFPQIILMAGLQVRVRLRDDTCLCVCVCVCVKKRTKRSPPKRRRS